MRPLAFFSGIGPIPQPRVERIPQAPRRDARQRWFTPAQYDDEILEADETTDSEETESSPKDDSEVAEELERQGRQWRADERARAREGERRAKELVDTVAKQAELARKKSARKSPERVRVDRIPRVDVRADRGRAAESG